MMVVDRLDDGHAAEGLGEVERAALVVEDLGAKRLARGLADQALGEVHQGLVIGIGLVELHHGEFGVVARRKPLIAEVAVDLEHLFEAADDEALEVELRRDAQEQFHVERVVVRGEGLGRGTAGDRVHHRRLDLEEAVVRHVATDRLDHAAARDEGEARFLVGDEVEVALAVFLLDVGETVELFRQRAQALRQQPDFAALHREFAGPGFHQRADRADDVAEIPLLEVVINGFADTVLLHVELNAARQILDRGEAGLAHDALEHDAAGNRDRDGGTLKFFLGLFAVELVKPGGEVLAAKIVGVGLAAVAPGLQLFAALGDDVVVFRHRALRGGVLLRGGGGVVAHGRLSI